MDSTRWACVVSRTPDSSFVYAVKTTKIYCRPTCSARLARRANVEFYNTSLEAEAAGYRSCKRCRPELVAYAPQDAKISRACDTICRYSLGDTNPPLSELAKEAGLTKYHFHRLFKKKTGLTPRQFTEALRGGDVEGSVALTPSESSSSAVDRTPSETGSSPGDGNCLQPGEQSEEMAWVNLAYTDAEMDLLNADLEFLGGVGSVDVFEASM
ncbi:hypothetical protein K461DRAFT_282572 [Myriangium duriaei CBS 260.36]|uniref:HTH araC/xylS-type domain-containing protein n=1 Tax=Myriangium duriaei CBS 260.36 TaxID=1168546 RepID=A0A9P4IWQ9_9PEZI|nr:hypothetical protein K461DRAFT_282572 [Myriangium duriaei CBS 260.36]